MAKLVIELKDGNTLEFDCEPDDGNKVIALAAVYHHLPLKSGDIHIDDVKDMKVIE